MMNRHSFPIWFLFIPIILLALIYVTSMLGADSLNRPEENTLRNIVWMGNRSIPRGHDDIRLYKDEIVKMVDTYSAQHIPGHYIQLAIWGDLVGLDLIMMRAVSMFYYLLTCAMVYRLTRDILSDSVAVSALFFVAFSGYHVYYAHEIRMYAIVVTQSIFIIRIYWHIMISGRNIRWHHWLSLFGWTVFGLYTHVLIIFPLLSIGIYHFIFAPKNKTWLKVAVAQILAGVAFLPWLPSAIHGINDAKDLSDTSQSVFEVVGSSLFIYSNGFWIGALLITVLIIWKYPRKNINFNYFAIIAILIFSIMLIFNQLFSYIPFRRMRYTLIWLPMLAVFWGYGLYLLYQYRRWLAMSFVLIWLMMFAWFNQSEELYIAANLEGKQFGEVYPYNVVGDYFRLHYLDYPGLDDWIVTFHPEISYTPGSLNYYEYIYDRKFEAFTTEFRDHYKDRLDKIDNNFPGFWFTYRAVDKEKALAWQESDEVSDSFVNYAPCLYPRVDVSIELVYYLDNRIPCDLLSNPDREAIVFDNAYVLRDHVIENRDSTIIVSLWWKNPDMVLDNSYGYSLQVFHDGEKVGQTDYPVDNVVTHSIVDLAEAVDGNYIVRLIVYSSEDVKSVGGQTDDGVVFERDIELGQVIIQSD